MYGAVGGGIDEYPPGGNLDMPAVEPNIVPLGGGGIPACELSTVALGGAVAGAPEGGTPNCVAEANPEGGTPNCVLFGITEPEGGGGG